MAFDASISSAAGVASLPLGSIPAVRKLLAAAIFAVGASLLVNPISAACACVFPLALVLYGRLSWRVVARRLLPVNAFFLFLWLTLPLGLNGSPDAAFGLGPFIWKASGLRLAGLITLKGNAIAAALLALAGTSGISECGRALLRLRVPAKLVALLLLTHRHISSLAEEASRLFAAAKLRGFVPRNSLAAYRTYAYLIAMLLIRSWQKSRRVGQAMRLRGFAGRFPLLEAEAFQRRRAGNALLACAALFTLLLFLTDVLLRYVP